MNFYTYGTQKDGDEDRSNYSQYLVHHSQTYLNHKSLALRIVVKRLVFVFAILFCLVVVVQLFFIKVVPHLPTVLLQKYDIMYN